MALGSLFPATPEMHSFLLHSLATKRFLESLFSDLKGGKKFLCVSSLLVDPKHQIHNGEHQGMEADDDYYQATQEATPPPSKPVYSGHRGPWGM